MNIDIKKVKQRIKNYFDNTSNEQLRNDLIKSNPNMLTQEEINLLKNIEKTGSINSSNWGLNKKLLDSLELRGFLNSTSSLWTRMYSINKIHPYFNNNE